MANFSKITFLQAIRYAPFGGETFVEAYNLRAKCNLKLSKYKNALYDSTVAIKYGGVNFERVLIKSIALYYLCQYYELKEFLLGRKVTEVFVESITEKEIKQLGYDLSLEFMKNFVLTESFVKTENEPEDQKEKMLKQITDFQANYTMDKRVEIATDPYKGRHMRAKEFIPYRSTILVERSYAIGLGEKWQQKHCLYCFSFCPSQSIPCKYCIDAIFCNEDCFEKAWNLFHQHECLLLSLLTNSQSLNPIMLYRVLSQLGMWNAIAVRDKFARLRTDPEMIQKASSEGINIENVINESIVNGYLSSETLKTVVANNQTVDQKMQVFELHSTLMDHNEYYEVYYDACYMSFAMNVVLVLLLSEYLQKQSTGSQGSKFSLIDREEIKKMVEENKERILEEQLVFGFPFEVFVKLVDIALINIRKLMTNVFSWQSNCIHEDTAVGTCHVLIGSNINHSCIPNVNWSFSNGCIIYTTTRLVR